MCNCIGVCNCNCNPCCVAPAGRRGQPGPAASISVYAGTNILTAGSMEFANSNGVSFGISGQTLTASVDSTPPGVTMSVWEPMPIGNNASSAFTSIQNTAITNAPLFYFQPVLLPQNLAVSRMNVFQSFSNSQPGTTFALNTTGQSSSRTFAASFTWGMGLYTREAGLSSSNISAVTTLQFTAGIQSTYAASVSSTDSLTASATANFIFPLSIGTDWNYAYTTLAGSASATTNVTTVAPAFSEFTALNGIRAVAFPFSSVMTPGEYFVALSMGFSTVGARMGWANDGLIYQNQMGQAANFGNFVSRSDGFGTASSMWFLQGAGIASTNSSTTAMPGQFALSNISSNSVANGTMARIYINFSNYSI